MTAYYNEIDAKSADWLRALINEGHIAPGDVDERSISDVKPVELLGYTQCHFFAGVGVWSYALRQSGWPDDRPVWTGSCPCQPFSIAGKRKGTSDERHLWPHWFHLISQCRPLDVFGEQVASKDGRAWFDTVQADMEALGFAIGAADLCAAGVGAPHIRQRLFFCCTTNRRAHSSDNGRERGADWKEHERRAGATPDSPKTVSRLGDTNGTGRSEGRERSETARQGGSVVAANGTQRVADDTSDGRRQERQDNRRCDEGDQTQGITAGRAIGGGNNAAYPTNGHWRDADWLGCRDGKFRPVEPGTFPLADGPAARVGRLRGYGNAIVAPVAQTFIEATQGW